MEQELFYILVLFICLSFAFDKLLDYLNTTLWSNTLPEELKEVYEQEQYERSQNYERENFYISQFRSVVSFAVIMVLLLFGGFGWLDQWVRGITEHPILMALAFFGVISVFSGFMSLPFDIYDTFVVEQKYGFNRQTIKLFFYDILKQSLLGGLIGGILISVFLWIYSLAGNMFWLYAWIAFSAFSVFIAMFYSTLIVPLFNKQTPLEPGELREAIESFAKKANFNISNIFVIDGSKRSTKANAYFSGLGKQKRIVLFDTLLNNYSTGELVSILAHEIGHYKKKHIQKGMVISILNMGLIFALIGQIIGNPALSIALGATEASIHMGLLAVGILFTPISMISGIIANAFSRKYEYEADAFAATHSDPLVTQTALKKLYANNLANLRPHSWYEFVHFSHPGLLKRLHHLKKFINHDTRNHSTG